MAHCLYVKGYKPNTTLDQLVIYFQSKESGGGDIDDEHCKLQENFAVIAFDAKEDCDSVLRGENHILKNGSKLTISPKPFKTPPIAKRRNIPPRKQRNNSDKNPPQLPAIEKPIIDEIRTVIVSGICPETTDSTLQFFFENERRSGGGDIENSERIEPQIAHITFSSSQVALNVLKKQHLEVDGYLLKLEAKKPKVTFPTDKKKLYVENLSTKTSKDSLLNYVEVITGLEVIDVVFGKNNNATVTLNEEPDMNKTREKAKKKPLEGAVLKITNPPVCNSILVTGISEETTKDSIVFKFENPKYGGGEILDVAYQQDQGKAVISYYDPNGTAYGRGIYFARDAGLSSGYTTPDSSGDRSMYVARVSVGQSTVGNSAMIVPPNNYDSVVDNTTAPTIFVSFYDNQYYPEYLITFR